MRSDEIEPAIFQRFEEALAGRYTVDRVLGQGGMAIVYRARDVRHERIVAVKVLRPDIGAMVGRERFLKEIAIAARLTHPNIVPLHDSGEAGGLLYYVMPYLPGETLRELISREGQLGVEQAVAISRGVAEALDYAHREGVIHRDIKPENILLHEHQPMVLDFGVALALSGVADERITGTGMSVGTPTYMSPEQAAGSGRTDARSDVYSLGCVLYEMLAGDPPFAAKNLQTLIVKIVSESPTPISSVRAGVPRNVADAIHRAMAKSPADRFARAGEFSSALVAGTTAPRRRRWRRVGVMVAAAVVIGAALFATGPFRSNTARSFQTTTRPLTSFPGWEGSASWAPGGAQFVYMHVNESSADLFVLGPGGVPRVLSDDPVDELTPRWSPDGSKIVFIADYGDGSALYWISPSGGTPRHVVGIGIPILERTTTALLSLGASPWSPDGEDIVFSRMEPTGGMSLWKVKVASGEVFRLTRPRPGDDDLGAAWSYDGRRIAFARMRGGVGRLYVMPASGGAPRPVLEDAQSNYAPTWMPNSEDLVFMSSRSGALNLWQVRVGEAALSRMTSGPAYDFIPVAAKETGEIAYAQFGHQTDVHRLNVADTSAPHPRLTAHSFDNFGARPSRDGRSFVYFSNRAGNYDVWLHDLETGKELQLTNHPANDFLPDFSPDGKSVAFLSDRDGIYQLWVTDREGRSARRLTDHPIPLPGGGAADVHFGGPRWSPDGQTIGYVAPADTGISLWFISSDGSRRRATRLAGVQTFDWYRDSSRVVYTRVGGAGVEMRAANIHAGEDVLLYRGPVGEVAVSPGGDAVSHVLSPSHFTMDLHVLRLRQPSAPSGLPRAVGEPRRITFGGGVWHVHNGGWFSDGRSMLYSRDTDRGDLFAVSVVQH